MDADHSDQRRCRCHGHGALLSALGPAESTLFCSVMAMVMGGLLRQSPRVTLANHVLLERPGGWRFGEVTGHFGAEVDNCQGVAVIPDQGGCTTVALPTPAWANARHGSRQDKGMTGRKIAWFLEKA
jgi:hypothetical protein